MAAVAVLEVGAVAAAAVAAGVVGAGSVAAALLDVVAAPEAVLVADFVVRSWPGAAGPTAQHVAWQ